MTSTGYFSLLVRGAVWGCSAVRCGVLAWSAFPLQRKRNLPEEREAHPRGDPKAQVRSEPIRGLLRGAGANDAQEADVRGVMEVEGA